MAPNEAQVRSAIKKYVEFFKEGSKDIERAAKERVATRQQRIEQLIEPIDMQIQIYLNGWQIQAVAATAVAEPPPEDDSKLFWYIALGGNLLWAGTCLINPAAGIGLRIANQARAALLVKVMSFAGATVGSGGVQYGHDVYEHYWKDPPPTVEDAKKLVADWIVQKHDVLEKLFKMMRREWATDLAALEDWGGTTEQIVDMHQQYIWMQMFPRIPYDSGDGKYTLIQRLCVRNIESMLGDFRLSWKQYWQYANWYGSGERRRRGIYFKYNPKVKFDLGTAEMAQTDREPGKFY